MPRIQKLSFTPLATFIPSINNNISSSLPLPALSLLLEARDAIAASDTAGAPLTSLAAEAAEDARDCALADAEVLLAHATRTPRHSLRLNLPRLQLQQLHVASFARCVDLRCSGVPVPYITRSRHFYDHEFFRDAGCSHSSARDGSFN